MGEFSTEVKALALPLSSLIKVRGDIDMQTAPILEQNSQRLLAQGQECLLMDFSEVDYINSQGLAVLLQVQKQLNLKGGGVVVAGMQERVKNVFLTTGADKVVNLYPDTSAALAEDPLFKRG